MRWMKVAGFVFIFGLVAACKIDAKTPNQCQADEQCPEGAYCDVGRALCVLACEKAGCLEGHFCDPDSHYCKDYCPHKCPDRPANATLLCGDVCVYACNDGFRECAGREGACLSDSSDPTACGPSCEDLQVCPVPENGTATCSDGACGYTCSPGFYDNAGACVVACNPGTYDNGGTCTACYVTEHCGPSCVDCTENGTLTGMGCNGGAKCFQAERFSRNTSVPNQPTVRDRDTTLIWQGCSAGYMGNDCLTSTGSGNPAMNWDAANAYCTALTWGIYASGWWRLPTEDPDNSSIDEELSTIVLKPCSTLLCIDATAFPNTPAFYFWSSSSSDARDRSKAWLVGFGWGDGAVGVNYFPKSSTVNVRCVRSGP